ncbi:MAG: 30S ribosomal protein S8 [Candidatus Tectomicrobia bacterium]|nr:30S ribosomal protein S8 [Candidatus Tectomicrobia bacterium]
MVMTDSIADMLTRIRNAIMAKHESVRMPSTKMKGEIARILYEEGFIREFKIVQEENHPVLQIHLKYHQGTESVIRGLKRVSKPGIRVYTKRKDVPRVFNGFGIAIISTPKGLVTDRECRNLNVGGEILCYVW